MITGLLILGGIVLGLAGLYLLARFAVWLIIDIMGFE
jgi:hypothetical protein